jgi:hypothetical protein
MLGHRLIGETAVTQPLRTALEAAGINPLGVAAFHRRGETGNRENP